MSPPCPAIRHWSLFFVFLFGAVARVMAQVPAITTPPLSRIAVVGQSLSFTVTASGAAPLSYQWKRNGQVLAGASGSTLTLDGAAVSDRGYYQLVVSNSEGTAESVWMLDVVRSGLAAIGWGSAGSGQLSLPPTLADIAAVAAGGSHVLALKVDGSVVAWGETFSGQSTVPGNAAGIVSVSAGSMHSVALRADGTVVAWGYNANGQTNVPAGLDKVVAISAGGSHTLALKADGTVVAWTLNASGQSAVPVGLKNVIAVAAGGAHSLALKADGTVVAWGLNSAGQVTVPAGLSGVVGIASGCSSSSSYAWRSDGTLVAWGGNTNGQTAVPAGLTGVVGVSSGAQHAIAVKADGTVAGWGGNDLGQAAVPSVVSNAVAVSAGSQFSFALAADRRPTITVPPAPAGAGIGGSATFSVVATSDFPVTYQWTKNGVSLTNSGTVAGATTATLTLTGLTIADSGNYAVVLTSSAGSITSPAAALAVVVAPSISARPLSRSVLVGQPASFSVTAAPAGVTYLWKRNGVTIAGATAATLSLPSAMLADDGYYEVIVGNAAGSLRSVVYLNVAPSGGSLVIWGDDAVAAEALSLGLNDAVAMAAGYTHVLALRADGTVVAWGGNAGGQTNVPVGLANVVAVSAGFAHSLALKADGTVVTWGSTANGLNNLPAGLNNVVAVSAGSGHSLALRADGTVVAWGANDYGQTVPPSGLSDVVAISGGDHYNVALRANGTVVDWGYRVSYWASIPGGLTEVVAVAAHGAHAVACKRDGTLVVWGDISSFLTDIPAGITSAMGVAAGASHNLALKSDGTVAAWGAGGSAVTVPAGLNNAAAIAAGHGNSLALVRPGPPVIVTQPATRYVAAGGNATFTVLAGGSGPFSYQWSKNGMLIVGATTSILAINGVTAEAIGNYSVVVTNSMGGTPSGSASLAFFAPPVIDTQPQSQHVDANLGDSVTFRVAVSGPPPFTYAWYKDGQPLPGANSASYTIANVLTTHSGAYSVVVSNDYGSVPSSTATLTATVPAVRVVRGTLADQYVTTWIKEVTYIMDGPVYVSPYRTLVIEAGTIVKARARPAGDPSMLIVPRGSQLLVNGTASAPVVFTAESDPLDGSLGAADRGLWGGVVLSGPGSINTSGGSSVLPGLADELRHRYGATGAGSAGPGFSILSYLSIRHAGAALAALPATPALLAAGSNGRLDHIEVFASAGDGIRILGGEGQSTYLSSVFNTGSGFSYSEGFNGTAQWLFVLQDADADVPAIVAEGGSTPEEAQPYTRPKISNVTAIGAGAASGRTGNLGIDFRKNGGGRFINGVFHDLGGAAVRIESASGKSADSARRLAAGDLFLRGSVFGNFGAGTSLEALFLSPNVTAGGPAPATNYTAGHVMDTANYNRINTSPGISRIDRTRSALLRPMLLPTSPALQSGYQPVLGSADYNAYAAGLTVYSGAFGGTPWLAGWSKLALDAYLAPPLAPVVLTPPVAQLVAIGGAVTLRVSADGDAPLTYQWLKDGAPLTGATGAALWIPAATIAQAGSYTMKVTNPVGVASSTAAQVVVEAISIGKSAGTPTAGGATTFSVIGRSATSYQWRFAGTPLAGATGATLTLTGLSRAKNGLYDVVLTYPDGTTVPPAFRLDVAPAANFDAYFAEAAYAPLFERDSGGGGARTEATIFDAQLFAGRTLLVRGNFTHVNGTVRAGLVRLTENGSLDPSFSLGATLASSDTGNFAVQGDGRILVHDGAALIRLTPDGARDAGFAAIACSPGAVLVDREGRILFATGASGGVFGNSGGVRRFTAAGAPDPDFLPVVFNGRVDRMAPLADGRIVIVGTYGAVNGVSSNGFIRISADGVVDTSYRPPYFSDPFLVSPGRGDDLYVLAGGSSPVIRLTSGEGMSADFKYAATAGLFGNPTTVMSLPDGRFLRASAPLSGGSTFGRPLGRHFFDGEPDNAFLAAGLNTSTARIGRILLQDDGRLLLFGTGLSASGAPRLGVMRLQPTVNIVAGPVDAVTTVGGSATFTVTATTVGTPAYQWYRDGVSLAGATGASYTNVAVAAPNFARYTVKVSVGEVSIFSAAATIRGTNPSPFITTVPQNVSVIAGQPAVFSVAATTESGTLVYQWRRSGVPLAGATASSYTVPVATIGDAGLYDVAVSAGLSWAVSPVARLSVAPTQYLTNAAIAPALTIMAENISGWVYSVAIAGDGKFYVGGEFSSIDLRRRPRLARFLADGSLDLTFVPPVLEGAVQTIRPLADGRVLVGGDFQNVRGATRQYSHLLRLQANGALDETFSEGSPTGPVRALVIQPDGKLVVGGSFTSFGGTTASSLYLVRFNADGTRDSAFNASPWTIGGAVRSVVVLGDGKILLGGDFTSVGGISRRGIVRLLADGALDTTFTTGTGTNGSVFHVGVQSDGRIIAAGDFTSFNNSTANRIVRLTSTGAHDPTFDPGTGFDAGAYALAILPDDKLVVGGAFNTYNSAPAPALVRLHTNGARDPGFTVAPNNTVAAIAQQPDGGLLLGGFFTRMGSEFRLRVARIDALGALDTGLNSVVLFPGIVDALLRVAGGKTMVGGQFQFLGGVPVSTNLARLNANGSVDTTFNSGGSGADGMVLQIAEVGDGRLWISGLFTSYNGVTRARLARVLASGALDATFNPGTGPNQIVGDFAVLPGARLAIGGGFTRFDGQPQNHVAVLHADGGLDFGFSPGLGASQGSTVYEGDAGTSWSSGGGSVSHLQLQPDGRLLVAGAMVSFNRTAAAGMTRLLADATVDSSFGGVVGAANRSALKLQPDGKILVGALFGVVRLNADGTNDSSFSSVVTDNAVGSFLLQDDGRVLVGGAFTQLNGLPAGRLIRLHSDGTRDTTFQLAGITGGVSAATFTDDGLLLLAGAGQPGIAVAVNLPAIVAGPLTQLATISGDVTFSVSVSGTAPFAFQWFKDGVTLSGATSATLHLSNLTAADAGSYVARVTNAAGTVLSEAAILTVAPAVAPVIIRPPKSQAVALGQAVTLSVTATGAPVPTYQWRKDAVVILGATAATYTINSVTASDAGSYTVVVSNSAGTANSAASVLTVLPSGASATHGIVEDGYLAGAPLTVTNSFSFASALPRLAWQVVLPPGWTLVSDTATTAGTRPAVGTGDLLEWIWTAVPAGTLTFSYRLNPPADIADRIDQLAALTEFMPADSPVNLLAKPDPLWLRPLRHSADTDRDFRISLFELTRIIELYNTRSGTTRTGRYTPQIGTEDGFAPDFVATGGAAGSLPRYHAADTNHDAQFSLVELTRVIELYNSRTGTTRTGAYHVQTGSEDNFAPGS